MNIDFSTVIITLKDGIVGLAEKDVKDYIAVATTDGQSVLNALEVDLKTWTEQMADGSLSKADFEDLVEGQKDELELVALKQAGLAEISVDQFKNDMFNLIKTTITALIP
jgi:hypothetical protein